MKLLTYSRCAVLGLILTAGLNVQADNLAPISVKLGTVTEVDLGFDVVGANISGFEIDRELIKKSVKGSQGIGLEVVKNRLNENFKLKITVPTQAPSFAATQFEIKTIDLTGSKKTLTIGTLAVEAIYEVTLHEELVGDKKQDVWTSDKQASFVTHAGGLKVRFLNDDPSVTHRIHADGLIPHQPDSLEPMKSNGEKDVYEVTIPEKINSAKKEANYYCHEHEGFGQRRTLKFNIDQE